MSFELSGSIKAIFPEQNFDSGFKKREFLLSAADGKFTNDFKFECLKEKIDLIDHLKEGDNVTVSFNIRCNEWQGKYFTNLIAWKIMGTGKAAEGSSEDLEPFDPGNEALDVENGPF
jgi:hypothetical protein